MGHAIPDFIFSFDELRTVSLSNGKFHEYVILTGSIQDPE